MDTATHFDTPLSGLDYLQYPPHSPFGVSMGCKNPLSFSHAFSPTNLFFPVPPTSSPRSFSSLPLSWLQHRLSRPSLHAHDLPQCALQLSAGDLSSDSVGSNRNRRGCGSHSPGPSARQAAPEEAFPKGSDEFASDDDDDFNPAPSAASNDMRREEIRRQRIESEQRRRDELRDGYRRLKDALPVSNQESSKVSLLDRGKRIPSDRVRS